MIKKIIIWLVLLLTTNTVNADYLFSGATLSDDFAGVYSVQDWNFNGYPYYKSTVDNYLFVASTYNGWPPYTWCVSDENTDFALQNCIFEKDTDILEIIWDYDGKVYPYDTQSGIISAYIPDNWTGTVLPTEMENKLSLSNDFFVSLNTKLKGSEDFQAFIWLVLVWITFLLMLLFLTILFFIAWFKRCSLLFNNK